jgi:hypothetical protein
MNGRLAITTPPWIVRERTDQGLNGALVESHVSVLAAQQLVGRP